MKVFEKLQVHRICFWHIKLPLSKDLVFILIILFPLVAFSKCNSHASNHFSCRVAIHTVFFLNLMTIQKHAIWFCDANVFVLIYTYIHVVEPSDTVDSTVCVSARMCLCIRICIRSLQNSQQRKRNGRLHNTCLYLCWSLFFSISCSICDRALSGAPRDLKRLMNGGPAIFKFGLWIRQCSPSIFLHVTDSQWIGTFHFLRGEFVCYFHLAHFTSHVLASKQFSISPNLLPKQKKNNNNNNSAYGMNNWISKSVCNTLNVTHISEMLFAMFFMLTNLVFMNWLCLARFAVSNAQTPISDEHFITISFEYG